MGNFKTEHKTTQGHREAQKRYEEKIRQDPDKNKQRLEYHKLHYRKMKEALKNIELMYQNTHEFFV